MSPIEKLQQVRQAANGKTEAVELYKRFILCARKVMDWSDADISEYLAQAKILMRGSDAEVLALYPAGLYQSANEARQGAIDYWKSVVNFFAIET